MFVLFELSFCFFFFFLVVAFVHESWIDLCLGLSLPSFENLQLLKALNCRNQLLPYEKGFELNTDPQVLAFFTFG